MENLRFAKSQGSLDFMMKHENKNNLRKLPEYAAFRASAQKHQKPNLGRSTSSHFKATGTIGDFEQKPRAPWKRARSMCTGHPFDFCMCVTYFHHQVVNIFEEKMKTPLCGVFWTILVIESRLLCGFSSPRILVKFV